MIKDNKNGMCIINHKEHKGFSQRLTKKDHLNPLWYFVFAFVFFVVK